MKSLNSSKCYRFRIQKNKKEEWERWKMKSIEERLNCQSEMSNLHNKHIIEKVILWTLIKTLAIKLLKMRQFQMLTPQWKREVEENQQIAKWTLRQQKKCQSKLRLQKRHRSLSKFTKIRQNKKKSSKKFLNKKWSKKLLNQNLLNKFMNSRLGNRNNIFIKNNSYQLFKNKKNHNL